MALVAVTLPASAGGRSVITLNMCGKRTGSNNDRHQYRIVRRATGQPDLVLAGVPDISLSSNQDVRSWTWIDDNIGFTGSATYVAQIKRVEGGGTLDEVVLIGQHLKR